MNERAIKDALERCEWHYPYGSEEPYVKVADVDAAAPLVAPAGVPEPLQRYLDDSPIGSLMRLEGGYTEGQMHVPCRREHGPWVKAEDVARRQAAVGRLPALQSLVDQQAEDEGLWFVAQTAAEAYLQQELRRLHAAIEGEGMMSCQLPFALPESTWRCQLPKGHYGPCAECDYGAKLEWPNPDTPLPVGRLTAEPEDRDVLAERFARDPISKEATIEHLQALLADVILQRNEFFARLERVEQEAGQVLNDQAGRLPALDALLRQLVGEMRFVAYRSHGLEERFKDAIKKWADELEAGVAGLRADPAPRQLLEEKEVVSRVETSATTPSAGSTAKNHGEG